jgi:hypothetical protein
MLFLKPTFPWHNFGTLINDVAGSGSPQPDGSVDANDALTIINYINAHGSGPIPASAGVGLPFGFLDTDITQGSGNQIVAGDVIQVINYINAGRPLGGEAPPEPFTALKSDAPAEPLATAPPSPANSARFGERLSTPSILSDDLFLLLAIDLAIPSTPRRRT